MASCLIPTCLLKNSLNCISSYSGDLLMSIGLPNAPLETFRDHKEIQSFPSEIQALKAQKVSLECSHCCLILILLSKKNKKRGVWSVSTKLKHFKLDLMLVRPGTLEDNYSWHLCLLSIPNRCGLVILFSFLIIFIVFFLLWAFVYDDSSWFYCSLLNLSVRLVSVIQHASIQILFLWHKKLWP